MNNKTPILQLNRFDALTGVADENLSRQIARRHATQGTSSVLFYPQPIVMASASGAWMEDSAGNRYLDMYNNVPGVGHCHPHITQAMVRQAELLNTNTRYLFPVLEQYADSLLATFPAGLSNVIFTCTGSESNDIALRMARFISGRQGIIVTESAYHGNTTAVMEVSPSGHKEALLPPWVHTIPAPDLRRLTAGQTLSDLFAADVERAMDALEARGFGCAALLVDTIFSSDGVFADPPGFLAQAVARVQARGGLFIADEVQPGFGRTGSHFWGFQRHSVQPDIVTLGKPMGNGFPMAAVITRPAILQAFSEKTEYFNTFGGNPVAAAVGLAVLEVIEQEALMTNAQRNGDYLRAGLRQLAQDFPAIADIRGAGLFNAIEFARPDSGEPDPQLTSRVIYHLKLEGVLIGAAGRFGNSLKIRPPLCFSRDDADFFLERLAKVMGHLNA